MSMVDEMEYWEREIATLSRERLREIQEERLKAVVKRAYEKTAIYRRKFGEAKVKPEDIETLEDIHKLPLTRYIEDFASTSVEEKLAVPLESITEIMTTSGTLSGFTQPVMMTERDVEQGFNLFARTCTMAGIKRDDIVQILFPWDASVPTLKKLACMVIPSIAGRWMMDNQIKLAKMLKSTVLFAFPGYIVEFVRRASELGIDLKNDASLRLALTGGEPLAPRVRRRVEEETGIEFRDIYGFAEVLGIGGECVQRDGLHIWADHYILEVIDPETEEVLEPGEEGELVITTLTKEAMPLIRYRTGDVTKLVDEEICRCGRVHPKIAPIRGRGRVEQMIKVQGVTLLPSDVEDLIRDIPGLRNEYCVIIDQEGELDLFRLRIEYASGVSDIDELRREVEVSFDREFAVKCLIELVPQGTLPQTRFKAQRIVRTNKK
jgi:phenylacetate-CoA ligase